MLATPDAFSEPVPMDWPSAKKVIVPVGIPPVAEATLAVIVKGWNCGTEAGDSVTAALVVPVVTVMLRAGAVLVA